MPCRRQSRLVAKADISDTFMQQFMDESLADADADADAGAIGD
ncbi:MAG: DUF3018 family protein [Candidatus Eremiobacteraeota bacterium]|nr:DUF3018 family protein [Candidatus Eremiobacteraeota bacterium]